MKSHEIITPRFKKIDSQDRSTAGPPELNLMEVAIEFELNKNDYLHFQTENEGEAALCTQQYYVYWHWCSIHCEI